MSLIKFKNLLKENKILFSLGHCLVSFVNNCIDLTHFSDRKSYNEKIIKIINNKKIILDIEYGGLGDWLIYTSLPRLLKKKYNVDFYLSAKSLKQLRNIDTFKICFESNPFFMGVSDDNDVYKFRIFSRDKSMANFFFDTKGMNAVEVLERQFDVLDKSIPEVYYKPKILKGYENTILVDKNYITGKASGWLYDNDVFDREVARFFDEKSNVQYVIPSKQNIFYYADMIFSCKRFITVLSGGAALASCFQKEFSVILPKNIYGGSVSSFVFLNSKAKYIK
jgi:hypothetical protein